MVNKATYSIYTYKNLVIVIHLISINTYDTELMYTAMKALVDLLSVILIDIILFKELVNISGNIFIINIERHRGRSLRKTLGFNH